MPQRPCVAGRPGREECASANYQPASKLAMSKCKTLAIHKLRTLALTSQIGCWGLPVWEYAA